MSFSLKLLKDKQTSKSYWELINDTINYHVIYDLQYNKIEEYDFYEESLIDEKYELDTTTEINPNNLNIIFNKLKKKYYD